MGWKEKIGSLLALQLPPHEGPKGSAKPFRGLQGLSIPASQAPLQPQLLASPTPPTAPQSLSPPAPLHLPRATLVLVPVSPL